MTDGRQISGAKPHAFGHGQHGPSGADHRGATPQRNRGLSPADEQALSAALARTPDDLLCELRAAWDMPAERPIRVVGRLTLTFRGSDGADMVFLNDLEHPETGTKLEYPTIAGTPKTGTAPVMAFVPQGISHDIAPASLLAAGQQWAMAEVELSSVQQRKKHGNPLSVVVRPGTVRLLTQIPEEWEVQVLGSESVRRIFTSSRDRIGEQIRKTILAGEEQLRQRHEETQRLLSDLAVSRRQAENDASRLIADLDQELAAHRSSGDAARQEAAELQRRLAAEIDHFERHQRQIQEETQLMQLRHRQLKELLTEKRDRLIALGLVDASDIDAVMPEDESGNDDRPGVGFAEALDGNFGLLAPVLQVQLQKKGLLYTQALLRDFLALLRTRDLVVLAGDSGSGKTSLVRAVAEAIGGVCTVVPVKPNWTGPEDLLGYYNPMERSYQATSFLVALQAAARQPEVPHFICLDEMNLARVEHYFADFLSLLEQRTDLPTIQLYTADEERHVVVEQGLFLHVEAEARQRAGLDDTATFEEILSDDRANAELHRLSGLADTESVLLHHARLRRSLAAQMRMPTSLTMPGNVWIFGAVNMDETTHQLSPKVLDRVHVLRFGNPMLADWDAIETEIDKAADTLPADLPSVLIRSDEIGLRKDYPAFDRVDGNVTFLSEISRRYLDPLGVEFGLRAIRQAQGYIAAAGAAGLSQDEALDNVVRHKVLPKMAFDTARPSGSGRARQEILVDLRGELAKRFEGTNVDMSASSVAELDRMIRLAEGNNGIVNYWLR
ncbi:McrB family protein [Sphingomonas sp. LR55]|uniref:McrB family protein n=1 Tax=Sphingomonas sp. LR55 TaxID=3050231 RepID=UPI002FE3A724